MAMSPDEGEARNTPSQKRALAADDSAASSTLSSAVSPAAPASSAEDVAAGSFRTLEPFDFEERLILNVRRHIVKQAVYLQCLENTNPVNLALVCKDWRETVKQEVGKDKRGWKAWCGIIGTKQERLYQQFLRGTLVYRPDPTSSNRMRTLKFADLPNPLEGTFDLSQCGGYG